MGNGAFPLGQSEWFFRVPETSAGLASDLGWRPFRESLMWFLRRVPPGPSWVTEPNSAGRQPGEGRTGQAVPEAGR